MNQLEKIKKHEEMKQLSIYSYDVNKRQIAEGYNLLGVSPMDNGFYACVVRKGNDITIVYQGTDFTKPQDYDDDIAMGLGKWPKQADNALDLYDYIKDEYPGCDVSVAGHSLGGSLAQIVGVLRNTTAVTFNAYGTKQIIKNRYGSMIDLNRKFENITNYTNPKDLLTTSNGKNQLGDCYEVMSKPEGGNPHLLETMESVKYCMPSSPEDLQMWGNKHKREKEDFEYYLKTGRRMPINMSSSGCVGSYEVSGYTRSDGKKIDSYTRTCGAKHSGQR